VTASERLQSCRTARRLGRPLIFDIELRGLYLTIENYPRSTTGEVLRPAQHAPLIHWRKCFLHGRPLPAAVMIQEGGKADPSANATLTRLLRDDVWYTGARGRHRTSRARFYAPATPPSSEDSGTCSSRSTAGFFSPYAHATHIRASSLVPVFQAWLRKPPEASSLNVTVLEARERIGGRVLSFVLKENPELIANLAAMVGDSHERMKALCHDFGIR